MEWKIKPGLEQCGDCGQPFDKGGYYYSSVQVEDDSILRKDHCTACFDPDQMPDVIFWRGRVSERESPMKRKVDFNILRELFFQMIACKSAGLAPLIYLVGLVLVRKRYLRLVGFFSQDGTDLMRVQRRRGDPVFALKMPLLDASDLVRLKDQLSELLSSDLGEEFDLSRLEKKKEIDEDGAAEQ